MARANVGISNQTETRRLNIKKLHHTQLSVQYTEPKQSCEALLTKKQRQTR